MITEATICTRRVVWLQVIAPRNDFHAPRDLEYAK